MAIKKENLKYRTKSLKLNMDDPEDRDLHEWLEGKNFTSIVKYSLAMYRNYMAPELLAERQFGNPNAMNPYGYPPMQGMPYPYPYPFPHQEQNGINQEKRTEELVQNEVKAVNLPDNDEEF